MRYLHALYFLNDEQSGTGYVDAVVFRGSAISYQAITFQFQRNKLDQLSYIVTDFQTDSLNNNSSGARTNYLKHSELVLLTIQLIRHHFLNSRDVLLKTYARIQKQGFL